MGEVGLEGPGCGLGDESRREPRMEECIEDLEGEVGERGGSEANENAGDVGRTVAVGDGGTLPVACSSWLKLKIWLRGRERRLDNVLLPVREATDGGAGPTFSCPLGGRLAAV